VSLVLSGVRVTRSLVLYVCFVDHCLSFELFLLTIVLSVLLRFTDSDYPFGIFKLFFLRLSSNISWSLQLPLDSVFFHSIYFVLSLKILFFIFKYRPILKLWWSSWILIFRRNENFVRDHPMINHVEFPFNSISIFGDTNIYK
jgi:hypothetical protein